MCKRQKNACKNKRKFQKMKLNSYNSIFFAQTKRHLNISFSYTKLLFLIVVLLLLPLQSCNYKAEASPEKDKPISDLSIYNLPSKWTNQEGQDMEMKDMKGKVLVMVMIYTSCKAACPRLVADMKSIAAQIPKEVKDNIQYVLISIDPTKDTPEVLKEFAITNLMDGEEWTFLQGNENSVREFANVLAVKYKRIDPIDFSHSNIISVFDPQGNLVHQQEGLGVDNKETVESIIKTSKEM